MSGHLRFSFTDFVLSKKNCRCRRVVASFAVLLNVSPQITTAPASAERECLPRLEIVAGRTAYAGSIGSMALANVGFWLRRGS